MANISSPHAANGPISAVEVADLFAEIELDLMQIKDGGTVLEAVVDLAATRIDGAEHAGVTVGQNGAGFHTPAATSGLVLRADGIQYDLGSGPCVDAVVEQTTFNAADLGTDSRWPEFGRRCVDQTGIISMLSIRLFIEDDRDMIAALNMYSSVPAAFGESSEVVGMLLATHGSLAVVKASAQAKVSNLERALRTSREIGTAMGILMAVHKVTRTQAFDMLRIASQRTHRKLSDLAIEVADTGALPIVAPTQQREPTFNVSTGPPRDA